MDMTIAEVALHLGVDSSRARRIVRSGDLPGRRLGRQWVVASEDVARMTGRARNAGRPMAPARAWGLLDLLDGGSAAWLSPVARSQTRMIARGLANADADRWRSLLRSRCEVVRVHAHPAAVKRLLDPAADTGAVVGGGAAASRAGVDLVALGGVPEVYVRAELWPALAAGLAVARADAEPNLLVRLPRAVWPFPGLSGPGPSALAADLLESGEPRALTGGLALLRQRLYDAAVGRP